MGLWGTLFGGEAEKEAADKNRTLYNDYQTKGSGYLTTGYNNSKGFLNQALDAYQPLSDLAKKYTGGTDMYLNALGLNGQSGADAAKSAFQAGPGYDWQLSQGLDAINRRRAAGGMLDSGNSDLDALKYGQGLADQSWNSWLSNLQGVNQNALSATSGAAAGQAGAYGSMSDLESTYAGNQIGLLGNTTSGLASANNTEAAGKAAGAKNLLGAGLSLASLAAGGFGGGAGGLGSALGKAFIPSSGVGI
ncbi:hypothetical protein [Bradyrhizobium oligotrophicum]|uniref:hypothetical protein n=1 Tax=Bradyrhizobium oligotrophicum TaxID=44255 RepID=UPI003EB789CC